jgi:hypothetical protein
MCSTVEAMYSLSYLYQALGDSEFADRAELAAFNALPAAALADGWAHQYITQPNQPYAVDLNEPLPFWNVNGRGTTFGLEPDYPCCVVNHPQGFPKFLANSWVGVGSDGLAHALLSPSTVTTMLGNGAKVSIEARTEYPFSDVLEYRIEASKAFTLHVRIPAWSGPVRHTTTTTSSSSSSAQPATVKKPTTSTGLLPFPIPAGSSTITVTLTRSLHTTRRLNNAISITHGPLLYTLDVGYHATSSRPRYYHSPTNPLPNPLPAGARDWQISNTSAWNIAIDASSLRVVVHTTSQSNDDDNNNNNATTGGALADPVWTPGGPPTYIEAEGCEIAWPLFRGVPASVPTDTTCLGPRRTVRLVPFGSAKIGMAELPTL